MTDGGLDHLSGLTKLESLDLTKMQLLTGEALGHLSKLLGLKRLRIDAELLSPAGINALAGLPDLDTLELCDSPLKSELIEALAKLEKLRKLGLPTSSPYPADAVKALKSAIPQTRRLPGTLVNRCPQVTLEDGSRPPDKAPRRTTRSTASIGRDVKRYLRVCQDRLISP